METLDALLIWWQMMPSGQSSNMDSCLHYLEYDSMDSRKYSTSSRWCSLWVPKIHKNFMAFKYRLSRIRRLITKIYDSIDFISSILFM